MRMVKNTSHTGITFMIRSIRIAIVLMYLSNVEKGGETVFPHSEPSSERHNRPFLCLHGSCPRGTNGLQPNGSMSRASVISEVESKSAGMKMPILLHGMLVANMKRTLSIWWDLLMFMCFYLCIFCI